MKDPTSSLTAPLLILPIIFPCLKRTRRIVLVSCSKNFSLIFHCSQSKKYRHYTDFKDSVFSGPSLLCPSSLSYQLSPRAPPGGPWPSLLLCPLGFHSFSSAPRAPAYLSMEKPHNPLAVAWHSLPLDSALLPGVWRCHSEAPLPAVCPPPVLDWGAAGGPHTPGTCWAFLGHWSKEWMGNLNSVINSTVL